MDLDRALEIVNDPSMHTYCDHVQSSVFVPYGEYELGIDARFDEIVYAFAYVSVELALDGACFEYVPEERSEGEDAPAA